MSSSNKIDQLLLEATRANGKCLLSRDEAVSLAEIVITPKRPRAEQARRDQFLAAAEQARHWVTMLTFSAQQDNWSEVEFLLGMSDRVCETMQGAFAQPNNKDGN